MTEPNTINQISDLAASLEAAELSNRELSEALEAAQLTNQDLSDSLQDLLARQAELEKETGRLRIELAGALTERKLLLKNMEEMRFQQERKELVDSKLAFLVEREALRNAAELPDQAENREDMLFDAQYYLETNPDVASTGVEPFLHFMERGFREKRNPHPLFDLKYYLGQLSDRLSSEINPVTHYLNEGYRSKISPHPLFESSYYRRSNPDLPADLNPLLHYLFKGAIEGRDPHPLFRTKFYQRANKHVPGSLNPLVHFIKYGAAQGFDPHPCFSIDFYLQSHADVRASGLNPLIHYLRSDPSENRKPHPLFDPEFYRTNSPSIASSGSNLLVHYAEHGAAAHFAPHSLFDPHYYMQQNPDVARSGRNLLEHYLEKGGFEGRNPHPLFDSAYYYKNILADGESSTTNPLVHFVCRGASEGRKPHPLFDTAFYKRRYRDMPKSDMNPLEHYIKYGAYEGRDPNLYFDSAFYLNRHEEVRNSKQNPLIHYILTGAAAGYDPHPRFQTRHYLKVFASTDEVEPIKQNPLAHFINWCESQQLDLASPQAASLIFSGYEEGGSLEDSEHDYPKATALLHRREQERINSFVPTPARLENFEGQELLSGLAKHLVLPTSENPQVSIIIPCFNQVKYTLECLTSIAKAKNDLAVEVIALDDCSSDQTPEFLPLVTGLIFERNTENLGFLKTANQAVALCSGEYIVFLNNDAQVTDHWLDELIKTFDRHSNVAAVGPKIIFPNGRLQEAGVCIMHDFSADMIGLFDDPALPKYNYEREVDYCSGACLMIKREYFLSSQMFSEELSPAYCEDMELSLKLRKNGGRCFYNPAAVVFHHLSVSSNRLGNSWKLAQIAKNQQLLSESWQSEVDKLNQVRLIAFYEPQYIPKSPDPLEVGKGSAEWTRILVAATDGNQPNYGQFPADLGYYDLRVQANWLDQMQMAARCGLFGFCYLVSVFNADSYAKLPIDYLNDTAADTLPFCIGLVDEDWTQRWVSGSRQKLSAEQYEEALLSEPCARILELFRHPKYIRINGNAVLIMKNIASHAGAARIIEQLRSLCAKAGLPNAYIIAVEDSQSNEMPTMPEALLDATIRYPLQDSFADEITPTDTSSETETSRVDLYAKLMQACCFPNGNSKNDNPAQYYNCVFTGWHTNSRDMSVSPKLIEGSAGYYRAWLESAIKQARREKFGDERMVFIHAWNDWLSGAHLEPDRARGHALMEATLNATQPWCFSTN
jgi:GT2 family glycosyltransferase